MSRTEAPANKTWRAARLLESRLAPATISGIAEFRFL